MKYAVKKAVMLVFALVFLFSVGMVSYRAIEASRADKVYASARAASAASAPVKSLKPVSPKAPATPEEPDAAEEPEEPPAPPEPDPYADALATMDLAALRETNPDVIGWISIPDTIIDYPLLQYKDNQYYLHRTWMKTRNNAGSIFMEHTNSPDLTDFSTIIYGHRMKSDKMFGSLRFFREQAYFQAHPYVYVTTDQGVYRYAIYAVYEAGVRSETYHLAFPTDADKLAFISYGYNSSKVASGIIPTVQDRILTLSTCTGTGYSSRWVVQAVLDAIYVYE